MKFVKTGSTRQTFCLKNYPTKHNRSLCFLLPNTHTHTHKMSQEHTHIKIQGDDEDYQDDDEEEEPRLKYQRLGNSVPSILSNDASSCLAVTQRMIALGTRNGSIHILDFLGNQVTFFSVFQYYLNFFIVKH